MTQYPEDDRLNDVASPVRTAAELQRRWETLLGSWGFDFESVWVGWFDERDIQIPHLMPIDHIPEQFDAGVAKNLFRLAMTVVHEGPATSIAMALTRPGSDAITPVDRHRACTLLETGHSLHVPLRPLFLACDAGVRPFAPDDLLVSAR
jgi:hypothetical protein